VARWGGRALVWLMVALIYFPLGYLALLSFSAHPESGLPGGFALDVYRDLFADGNAWSALRTSALAALVVAAIVVAIALPAARTFATVRNRSLLVGLSLLPLLVPGVALGSAAVIYFQALGIPLSVWTVIIVQAIWAFPFAFLALIIVTLRFNPILREAANDLGASPSRAFVDVELPLLMPGVQAALIFAFLLAFNELIRSYLVRGSTTTLPIYFWTMMTAHVSTAPLIYGLTTVMLLASLTLLAVVFGIVLRPR
jgi:ABC-type spermidine/putrescine transport system permease subunit II